ncbi:MAG: efflux RND transporter permease subunit, partial [Myxococcota bacterium]
MSHPPSQTTTPPLNHHPSDDGETKPHDDGTHPNVDRSGPLAFMADNSVAANLLMAVIIFGGFIMLGNIQQEFFPEVELDTVQVQVPYPGASPAEVEQGIVLAVEEEVRGIDGVKEVTSTAREGMATVSAELLSSADPDDALSDIRSAISRITSFPEDAEEPTTTLLDNRSQVLALVISGDMDERTLRNLAERTRLGLLQSEEITLAELDGVRQPEISIEVPQASLRRYGLTLDQVAQAIRRASVELPGGSIETDGGEILIRTTERRDNGGQFRNIVVIARPNGTRVTLEDLGAVIDGFEDVDREATLGGKPAARVLVYRVGSQTPIGVSDAVKGYMAKTELPPGVTMTIWNDTSDIYRQRVDLLLRNAQLGLALVLLVLGLFLEIKLAFWVTMGIVISFFGAIFVMPALAVSFNMISLFAFILALGIVVDDAIVVGEAVYKHRQDGLEPLDAAIAGVREVAWPVVAPGTNNSGEKAITVVRTEATTGQATSR